VLDARVVLRGPVGLCVSVLRVLDSVSTLPQPHLVIWPEVPMADHRVDPRVGLTAVARRGQPVGRKGLSGVVLRTLSWAGHLWGGRALADHAWEGQREPWLRKSVGRL
jgi:hypothetical protein